MTQKRHHTEYFEGGSITYWNRNSAVTGGETWTHAEVKATGPLGPNIIVNNQYELDKLVAFSANIYAHGFNAAKAELRDWLNVPNKAGL